MSDLINSFVEISFNKEQDFLKIKETLTRIGVASRREKKLYQSCHVLHKQGKYYLVHFKELFALDGKPSNFVDDDIARRNTIAHLLEEWGLLKIIEPKKIETPRANLSHIKILPFKEKEEWELVPKYAIGKIKRSME